MMQVVILAAGRGVRMGGTLPKVLVPLAGKPMIAHLLEAVERSGVCATPAIVVGHKASLVRQTLGPRYRYIEQRRQLGTGHAVKLCREAFQASADEVFVLYGDHPLITASTITRVAELHAQRDATLTMVTTTVPNFQDWRSLFCPFGRVLRQVDGSIAAVVERKDATEAVLAIRELNTGILCFNAKWLFENLPLLTNRNAAHEYYLPDLVPHVIRDGHPIVTLTIGSKEAIGISTPEDLALAEDLLRNVPL